MLNLFKKTITLTTALTLATLGAYAATGAGPRERSYDATHYRLEMALDPTASPKEFEANLQMSLSLTKDSNEIELDTHDLSVKSVALQQPKRASLTFDVTDPKYLKVSLPSTMKKGTKVRL